MNDNDYYAEDDVESVKFMVTKLILLKSHGVDLLN